ncbi:GIY-YIG nuclease family protein [Patescibacteria group bacterium]|nr:GIY-YIG nuclease family protein [Patescibacteria group bacterium]
MSQYKKYFVYIMASETGTLYIGVTNNILRRVWEHKFQLVDGFTKKYDCYRLVRYEEYNDINIAIAREKQLKNWSRKKKEDLIKTDNPPWTDLAHDWYPTNKRKIKKF